MALSDAEIQRALYHLGYPAQDLGAVLAQGNPTLVQAIWPAEGALRHLRESAEGIVRTLLDRLDTTEGQMLEAQERLAASAVGDIELRSNEVALLEESYRGWVTRLSSVTGAPVNPSSPKSDGRSICVGRRV